MVDIVSAHATDQTVTDYYTNLAVVILRNELLKKEEFYHGFMASIESALKEAKPYMGERKLAESIMNRIIG